MIKIFSTIFLPLLLLAVSFSCNSVTSQSGANENFNNESVNDERQDVAAVRSVEDVKSLCNKLSELKRMPHKDKVAGDYIYDGLVEKGKDAIPCLIEKITDVTPMGDPREAPHISSFRVGDAAVFMLHRIAQEPLQSILPNEAAKQWETEGVFAYVAYVEKPRNRKKIQQRWKDWMKRTPVNQ